MFWICIEKYLDYSYYSVNCGCLYIDHFHRFHWFHWFHSFDFERKCCKTTLFLLQSLEVCIIIFFTFSSDSTSVKVSNLYENMLVIFFYTLKPRVLYIDPSHRFQWFYRFHSFEFLWKYIRTILTILQSLELYISILFTFSTDSTSFTVSDLYENVLGLFLLYNKA